MCCDYDYNTFLFFWWCSFQDIIYIMGLCMIMVFVLLSMYYVYDDVQFFQAFNYQCSNRKVVDLCFVAFPEVKRSEGAQLVVVFVWFMVELWAWIYIAWWLNLYIHILLAMKNQCLFHEQLISRKTDEIVMKCPWDIIKSFPKGAKTKKGLFVWLFCFLVSSSFIEMSNFKNWGKTWLQNKHPEHQHTTNVVPLK